MDSSTPPNTLSYFPSIGAFIDNGALQIVEVLTTWVGYSGVVYRAVDTRTRHPSGQKKYFSVRCLCISVFPNTAKRQKEIYLRGVMLHRLASAHPGIIDIHHVFEQDNRLYIITNHAPNGNLATQIFEKGRYIGRNADIKSVYLQLLEAVDYCHSIRIAHMHLTPRNIVCFQDGLRVSITNFGLATTERFSENFRQGSVRYMSPECHGAQFTHTGKYSPKFNDIWSLGIIMLNMITGRNCWMVATPDDPFFRDYSNSPFDILPVIYPISSETNNILSRMLHPSWYQRSTLHEVRMAVENVTNFYSEDAFFSGGMACFRRQEIKESPLTRAMREQHILSEAPR
ncbi:Negative regulator of sexual conjugation and meiosis [Psilocybe cubensis]|uniref:Negative regulator of sexual conjugation and meiosis n=2 Tax=Psilocybe cubensis TaxID=181762 RepID=A0ACB8H021_PSICU|nr:Negative regulator of sexual conjugation and meiosis [Psilocybe cubensis]KAH9481221.1 Negative regulator of sexual conjugation and meiosis [Psilocybe cubensis]